MLQRVEIITHKDQHEFQYLVNNSLERWGRNVTGIQFSTSRIKTFNDDYPIQFSAMITYQHNEKKDIAVEAVDRR